MSEQAHPKINYVKIWGILLILLFVSILGPMIGIKWLTLITAFGVAVVKALMVCGNFMHLKFEKKIAWYILITILALMFLFFFAVAPDVMKHKGNNWVRPSPQPLPVQGGGHH